MSELIRGDGDGPGDRMVRSAAALFGEIGPAAAGMREVADHAAAPRGSIRHHFPGGKAQLMAESLTWIGAVVSQELEDVAAVAGPIDVLRRFVALWSQVLDESDLARGCSVAAVVHASPDGMGLDGARAVFRSWRRPFETSLRRAGVPRGRAGSLATTVVAALEGAVILCRAERTPGPLRQTARELETLLRTACAGATRS